MDTPNRPHFGQFIADAPRLSSGHLCSLLLFYFWAKTWDLGQEWSNGMTLAELAQYCHRANSEQVCAEIESMESRGLIQIQRFDYGQLSVRLVMEDWEALPDYTGKGPVR